MSWIIFASQLDVYGKNLCKFVTIRDIKYFPSERKGQEKWVAELSLVIKSIKFKIQSIGLYQSYESITWINHMNRNNNNSNIILENQKTLRTSEWLLKSWLARVKNFKKWAHLRAHGNGGKASANAYKKINRNKLFSEMVLTSVYNCQQRW